MSFLTQPISILGFFRKNRKIGGIKVNVIVNEITKDDLTITKQPVQQGATITDHAFKEPTVFSMTILQKANLFTSLSDVYQKFLDLQNSREPFDIITPKRVYKNMLFSSLSLTTDAKTENCLSLFATFQEVIIVSISTATVPKSRQRLSQVTGAIENAGKKSALFILGGG